MNINSTKQHNFVVHKFGGTSVANSDRYKGVAEIMTTNLHLTDKNNSKIQTGVKAIVVSAMSKVTDALIELTNLAKNRDEKYLSQLEVLYQKHIQAVQELLTEENDLLNTIKSDFEDIKEILRGLWLIQSASMQAVELVSGYGEVWSAQILNAYLQKLGKKSAWLDARQILEIDSTENSVLIHWDSSQKKMSDWLLDKKWTKQKNTTADELEYIVITGFVASTKQGIPTTLKRNGSDFSASIFGSLLQASEISIWTDVDGVLSADPRLVPEAVVLDDMSYNEATELAYFGAKVVHPSTMAPAISKKIPIWIRNTFHPKKQGTLIHFKSKSNLPVKGFSIIEKVALVNVEGTGMIGIPGVAQRLFGALKEVNISVIMISQASSEQSICFAVMAENADLAKQTLEKCFFAELHHGSIQRIDVSKECSVLAAVGDNMISQPGIAAKFFSALGQAGVNIRAIAQGSSERNISVVIDRKESIKALRAAHAGFFLSSHTLSVGIIGVGWIGKTFIKQLSESLESLKNIHKIDIRVRGIANSKNMCLSESAIDLIHFNFENLKEPKKQNHFETLNLDLLNFSKHIKTDYIPHAVIIDCTADAVVANQYVSWLEKGIHVITPNKKANAGDLDYYLKLKDTEKKSERHYLYETTVGAGLPIINTLRDLVRTGDKIIEVEGILSGTLSFLFNSFNGQSQFSEIVRLAKEQGYTEPDPRDDLSGTDVARKLVILGREIGLKIQLSDVKVESLVPEELKKLSIAEYMDRIADYDQYWQNKLQDCHQKNQVLRYVGRLSVDTNQQVQLSVQLKAYSKDHAFAMVKLTDNIIAFKTFRYQKQPLIVQGPGAGPDVTAGGVFADLLRLCSYLGAV